MRLTKNIFHIALLLLAQFSINLSSRHDYTFQDLDLDEIENFADYSEDAYKRTLKQAISKEIAEYMMKDHLSEMEADDDSFTQVEEDEEQDAICEAKPMFRYTQTDVDKLFHNLLMIHDFFAKHKDKVIVDGLFGLRAAEGSLHFALKHMSRSHTLYSKIKVLYDKYHSLCEKLFALQKAEKDVYQQSFLNLNSKPIVYERPYRKFKKQDVWEITKIKEIEEDESDRCVQGIIGEKKKYGKCHTDTKCMKEESLTGTESYYLTHQALFFMAGETFGCRDKFLQYVSTKQLERFYDQMGHNMYAQMMTNDWKDSKQWDITSEQGMICMSFGIVECFRMDKLRESLKWLTEEGCVNAALVEQEDDLKDESYESRGNYKRVEAIIGKCSQHMTAVLVGFYSNHLRFITQPPPCHLISY